MVAMKPGEEKRLTLKASSELSTTELKWGGGGGEVGATATCRLVIQEAQQRI